jgi:hypothetical protein
MRTKPFTTARARAVALILAGIAAGSLLSGPAVAHTGSKISHLTTHLDGIYLNEDQKATDANQLDGLDSGQFLRSNGKAADADLLDGVNSSGFLTVAGKAADAELLDGLSSSAFLQGGVTYTRQFSCSGTAFMPDEGTWDYGTDGSLRYSKTVGGTTFRCNVVIPNGAVVTRVDFSVKDDHAVGLIPWCEMYRTNLLSGVTETKMADAGGTTGPDAPGDIVLSDTTINSPTIDNSAASYFLLCAFNSDTANVGVYGAIVTYAISGASGGG